MFRPRVIPVLLLKNKGLVKTTSFNKKKARYIGDPINAVRIFNDLEADELVFLDILATKDKRTIDVDLVKRISDEAFMPFGVGGGITQISQVDQLLNNGAEKVILNTAATQNPSLVKEVATKYGSQSVAVCIDVKKNLWGKNRIYSHGGDKSTKLEMEGYLKQLEDHGVGEIIIQSIDKDGTMSGYATELTKSVSNCVNVPVVALGGASSINDMYKAYDKGKASALAAGSMFVFHGARKGVLINYPDKATLRNEIKWIQ